MKVEKTKPKQVKWAKIGPKGGGAEVAKHRNSEVPIVSTSSPLLHQVLLLSKAGFLR